MDSFLNFRGLYGENQSHSLSNFVDIEALETRSKAYNWEINEHLHTDLFQIFIISSGEGLLISEHKKMTLNAPCILIIPANTLHGFGFQSNIVGDVLTFSESFFESSFKNQPHILLEINILKYFSFDNKTDLFQEMLFLKDKIAHELSEKKEEKKFVLHALFQLFFVSLYRLSLETDNHIAKSDNRTLAYFQGFQKNIKQSLHESKSITQYAQELNITAVHLNRICQTLLQKSALQIIQEQLISEAKKYISNTDYSISEIAYFLDFKDPAYFTRFFKKQTGFSPKQFRKNELA
jgi:AraC family transcriptional activator of pobA